MGKKFQIILTETQLSNAQEFFSRVQLSGKEVIAYVPILNALNTATEITPTIEDEKKTSAN
jgi:hypothetical protein